MPRPRVITSLDLGTGSIKILCASRNQEEKDFDVLGRSEEASFGIRKGVIVDPAKVSEIISSLVEKTEEEADKRIDGVYASIEGGHISCVSSRGLVSVSRADRKISEEDVDRVKEAAKTFSLPSNKEIIDIFPREYIVDGVEGVKEPVGMDGVRLEADVLILCCFSPYLKNTRQAIFNSDLRDCRLLPAPLASAKAVLTPREKELGVVVLDIGAGTTGMSVFEEGGLIDVAIFPVGSAHITNDIAVCLKTDIDSAEKIKLEFGSCKSSGHSKKAAKTEKKIKIEGEEPLVFSRKLLAEIIEARASEIFDLASKELKRVSKKGLLPAGIVLTGGGAKLPGIRDLAKKELKLPCRIGVPKNFPSLPEDPSLATVCGLIEYGAEMEEGGPSSNFGRGFGEKIKGLFKAFVP